MAKQPASAWVKPAALGGILILVILLLGSRFGAMPPPGKFFNPWRGFWRNAEAGGIKGGELRLDGLREPVSVAFDDRGVPHIFAQNAHDLYFAQGYITARDRLWQMEIQTHAAAGRLAEFLGPDFLERDRFQRRLGLPRAAEPAPVPRPKRPDPGDPGAGS
jgi:penicillin G amidase